MIQKSITYRIKAKQNSIKPVSFSWVFLFLVFVLPKNLNAQCDNSYGIIWLSNEDRIKIGDLAKYCAPLLWFSPDEPGLYDEEGNIQLPEAFPFDMAQNNPIVYYKVKSVYSSEKDNNIIGLPATDKTQRFINLKTARAIDIEYYMYYRKETGLGGHPHDIESVAFQLQVKTFPNCPFAKYSIHVKKVIGRAHGLTWFENAFKVDETTKFPVSILIEEGKHASCTDKNADGVYTPGYDVTEKVNDAWGVRDIISSGKLFSGGYQAWMAKLRTPGSILLPPLPKQSPYYSKFKTKYSSSLDQTYTLRAYPEIIDDADKKLYKLAKNKKPLKWPRKIKVSGDGSILQWSKENKLHKKIGISYRIDEVSSLSFSVPLLLFKNVAAPMTGGWIYNKIYLGGIDPNGVSKERGIGHQITHTNSASRWLDTYIGLGYEFLDDDPSPDLLDFKAYFVAEAGIKIRVNISHTPLKFLKFLGTDYWGIKLGWKNIGFNPSVSNGMVVEFGAGAF